MSEQENYSQDKKRLLEAPASLSQTDVSGILVYKRKEDNFQISSITPKLQLASDRPSCQRPNRI